MSAAGPLQGRPRARGVPRGGAAAELAEEVRNLRAEAFIIRTLHEMWAGASASRPPTEPPRRPRHLYAVGSVS